MPEEKETAAPAPPGVSRKDADAANSGPAPWANKFVVVLGSIVRIAFLEQGGPEESPFFRGAVSMSFQDAIALKNLLNGMLADAERQIQAATEAAAGQKHG